MLKTILTVLGWTFIAVGLIGFVAPAFLGAHLSITHNVIHLVSGAAAIWFGSLKASLNAAKNFAIAFGVVYGLLGVAGFLFGETPGYMLTVIPNAFVVGTTDHMIHIVLASAFLVGAYMTHPIEVRTRKDTRVPVS